MIKDQGEKVTANDWAKSLIVTGAERFARKWHDIFEAEAADMTAKEKADVNRMAEKQLNRVVKMIYPDADPVELPDLDV